MHSKWQIWDFFSSYDRGTLATFEGTLAINTFDPLCLKMVKDFLLKGAADRTVHHKMASDVNKGWIEEEFQALSLFGNIESFVIHQAQDLKVDMIELISQLGLEGRFLILSFESEGNGWKKLIKDGKIATLQIEAPRFWEINKLLDFTSAHLRLPLSYDAKAWILDSLENNFGTFYNSCCLIKLNHPEAREISLSDVKELLTLERLDQFALASLYCRKKSVQFFEKLVALEGDFDKMRGFFNFMQSHLIKLADTSYLSQKPRLTQYDKDLQSCSKLWKAQELMNAIDRFNRWELMCKKKDTILWHEVRETFLRSLTP
ncbi:MAG TPA: hypothetical protein VNJ08_15410 [Bacteriovoracaceae bacterium]|nr:hypothetical protein [Bacteriovoracaceae bacterium]